MNVEVFIGYYFGTQDKHIAYLIGLIKCERALNIAKIASELAKTDAVLLFEQTQYAFSAAKVACAYFAW